MRVSVLFVNEATGAESSQQNGSQVATAPAANILSIFPPAGKFELKDPETSSDTELLPDADRDVWPRHKALFLIVKYKEFNKWGSKKGGFG